MWVFKIFLIYLFFFNQSRILNCESISLAVTIAFCPGQYYFLELGILWSYILFTVSAQIN